MNIQGKLNLFVTKYNDKEGNVCTRFETNVAHKNEDGTYSKGVTIRVDFTKDCFPLEEQQQAREEMMYTYEVVKGFIDARTYVTKEGQEKAAIRYVIQEGRFLDKKEKKPSSAEPKKFEF